MLDDLKQYLRLDEEDTEEDSFLGFLINTAKNYIKNATGKEVDEDNPRHKLAVMLFCSHQYENRNPVVSTSTKTLEYSLQSLITQIEWGD
ncbi:Phage gp6-like head-tail connector protein [compost metagenome]